MVTQKSHEFPVNWSTFDPALKRADGFVHIVIVDDYTSYCLWDELLDAIPRLGSRPAGMTDRHQGLPPGNWDMLHAMHQKATDGLYAKAGITKPLFRQLPAVYAVKHGEPIGHYVLNTEIDAAVDFIKAHI
jgi:hypothetical protein